MTTGESEAVLYSDVDLGYLDSVYPPSGEKLS